jgi:hypothetical protein
MIDRDLPLELCGRANAHVRIVRICGILVREVSDSWIRVGIHMIWFVELISAQNTPFEPVYANGVTRGKSRKFMNLLQLLASLLIGSSGLTVDHRGRAKNGTAGGLACQS